MTNRNSLPPEKLEGLLHMASRQLGTSPQQLREQLEKGQLGQLLGSLDPQRARQVSALMNDPKKLEQLLGSAQVRQRLNNLKK